uniref:Uncharacterized protein n=1 Tax=Anopheles christyi TaxID=43041 RepID=A0A182KDY7_9DIPT
MDAAKSGEESSETVPAQAAEMDGMPVHDSHAPQMREMIHDSPHPVEIDMGPGMQARIMGFEGEVEEGNFGRAAEGEENEEEGGAQFRHFKHKHKKQKHVIHTHHHYHHKKGYGGHGGGYGHGEGYGHHGHDHGYGHHGHGGGHGYHGGHDEGDDYEPSYGHHGRYRRSPMSETAPMDEEEALDAQDHPTPNETGPSTVAEPGTSVYRQSVSRRQLVRSKNERLAQIGRDRAQRANRYAESQHDSDGPCPAEYVEAEGEVVGSAQDADSKVFSDKRRNQPITNFMRRLFGRKKKQGPIVNVDSQKPPPDAKTIALREEIAQAVANKSSQAGSSMGTEMKTYLSTKGKGIVGGPQAVDVGQESSGSNTTAYVVPLPGTFIPELGTIVSVRFVDETGRERTIPYELTSRQLAGNGTAYNPSIPLNYNFFYFHCLSPRAPTATTAHDTRLRSMTKRMIAGLGEGGRTGRTTGEEGAVEAGEGFVPQRWLHRRRTKSEWRRRDASAGRRRRPMPAEKVVERRAPGELPSTTATMTAPMATKEVAEHEQDEEQQESDEDTECDDEICSNFYIDEQKLSTTSTTPRASEHRLDQELEQKLTLDGNDIETQESFEEPQAILVAHREDRKLAPPSATSNTHVSRNSLWRGLSKRLSAFRERQAGKGARRKPLPAMEPPTTMATSDLTDDETLDSNEIVEYYQQDVGRVLYRMANGRVLEEPQRYHLRRSSDDEKVVSPRQRRLNRINKRRKEYKDEAPAEDKTPEPKKETPIINIGSFRMPAGGAPVSTIENTGASHTVGSGSEMDNYIMQKVREYCSTSCTSGKVAQAPVIIVPEKHSYAFAYPPNAVAAPVPVGEQIVGSQLIVQPPGTYSKNDSPTTRAPEPATTPRSCPTKIVKCIPRAMSSKSQKSRKPGTTSNDEEKDTVAGPLVAAFRPSRVP